MYLTVRGYLHDLLDEPGLVTVHQGPDEDGQGAGQEFAAQRGGLAVAWNGVSLIYE